MINLKTTVLLCPRNDEESLQILKIAHAIGLSTVVSEQPHGARLEKEPQLITRIRNANSSVQTVVIVEIPGQAIEKDLQAQGLEVMIIDHHQYDGLDRSSDQSSLEQFLNVYRIDDGRLKQLGFNPVMVRAVAAMDRGFIWELKKELSDEEGQKKALAYYRSLTLELGRERRLLEEEVAKAAWHARTEQGGVIIVQSEREDVSFRDALSFLVAETFDQPRVVLIRQGKRRLYVQDSDVAERIYEKFGGFLFGQNRCWGVLATEERSLPSIDEVLSVIE